MDKIKKLKEINLIINNVLIDLETNIFIKNIIINEDRIINEYEPKLINSK